jgi:nitrile hydratase
MSHDHDHDHAHEPVGHDGEPPAAARVRALEELLVGKGVVEREDIRRGIDSLVSRTPADGARLVARAWADPEFKERLLTDARTAAAELGLDAGPSPEVVAVENTEEVHHMVVCTLCSCYPRALLGPPPAWYKSLPYRSRAVAEPRAVLAEFGLDLDPDVELRVLDSTADVRYLVLPRRPEGTEGLGEEELAALVTRDSMIGVAQPMEPVAAGG